MRGMLHVREEFVSNITSPPGKWRGAV